MKTKAGAINKIIIAYAVVRFLLFCARTERYTGAMSRSGVRERMRLILIEITVK